MPELAEDIKAMSFEQAMRELEMIVRKLESGQGELESAMADYTRGNALKEHCRNRLASARMKVEKIVNLPDGSLSTAPFDHNNS